MFCAFYVLCFYEYFTVITWRYSKSCFIEIRVMLYIIKANNICVSQMITDIHSSSCCV